MTSGGAGSLGSIGAGSMMLPAIFLNMPTIIASSLSVAIRALKIGGRCRKVSAVLVQMPCKSGVPSFVLGA